MPLAEPPNRSVSCGRKRPQVRDHSPKIVLTQDGGVGRHRRSALGDPLVQIVDWKVATAQRRCACNAALFSMAIVRAVLAEDTRPRLDDRGILKVEGGSVNG